VKVFNFSLAQVQLLVNYLSSQGIKAVETILHFIETENLSITSRIFLGTTSIRRKAKFLKAVMNIQEKV
jgi:hypothetical protein